MTEAELNLIREHLELDPTLPGGLRWKKPYGNSRLRPGSPAGGLDGHRYYRFTLDGKRYTNHRVILWLNGILPTETCNEADHIDRNKTNNLISNLRWVDSATNNRNRRSYGCVPWRFVHCYCARFIAQYRHPLTKKKTYVGLYDDAYEAHCEALAHRLENHWSTP